MRKKLSILLPIIFLIIFCIFNKLGFLKKMSQPERVNWQSSWIRKSGPVERKNFYYLARKTFNLSFTPKQANLFISCQSRCLLYINGQVVQKIGLYSNPPYQYFDYFQVSDFLKKGQNVIAILGYNENVDTFFGPKKQDGLLFQLEIKYGWQKKIVVSDQSWKMANADAWDFDSERIWSPSAGFQEIFDKSKFPNDWEKASFDDSSWEKAEIIENPPQKPWEKLVLRPIPYLIEKGTLLTFFQNGNFSADPKVDAKNPAVFINSGKKTNNKNFVNDLKNLEFQNNQFISFSLPKQIVGGVKICFEKGSQGTVDIGYAETLNKEGFPDTGRMIFQGDRILNPTDGFCWQSFSARSFKYLILVFRDFSSPIKLASIEGIMTEYPTSQTKQIDFGDQLLNEIYQIGIDTLKIDMQETLMDCPVRERAQYVGDGRIESLVAFSIFGETQITKKALTEFSWSQDNDGYLAANYPTGNRVNIPTYALQWVNMLWEYYQNSGDETTLKNLYPTLLKLMGYFEKHEHQTIGFLSNDKDWWVFIDHGDMVLTQNYSTVLQSSYYGSLVDAEKIANVLKDIYQARQFQDKAKNLKEKINEYFWNEEKGLFDDCRNENGYCQHFSQQTNYWLLYWEAVNNDKKDLLLKNLWENKLQLPSSKTPFFNGFVAEVLFRNNRKEEAITFIKNYWGKMIKAGATTWWEGFDDEIGKTRPKYGESMAHAWGSLPTYLLKKYLAK